jgi:hypothetical protein
MITAKCVVTDSCNQLRGHMSILRYANCTLAVVTTLHIGSLYNKIEPAMKSMLTNLNTI